MTMRLFGVLTSIVTATTLLLGPSWAGEKAKYSIKEVMKEAHKGGLMKKVASGQATQQEKDKLVDLYVALQQNKPPKGEEGSWKEQTEKLIVVAKKAAKGDDAAAKSLPKVVQCGACHNVHK